jgi:ribonuclease I
MVGKTAASAFFVIFHGLWPFPEQSCPEIQADCFDNASS